MYGVQNLMNKTRACGVQGTERRRHLLGAICIHNTHPLLLTRRSFCRLFANHVRTRRRSSPTVLDSVSSSASEGCCPTLSKCLCDDKQHTREPCNSTTITATATTTTTTTTRDNQRARRTVVVLRWHHVKSACGGCASSLGCSLRHHHRRCRHAGAAGDGSSLHHLPKQQHWQQRVQSCLCATRCRRVQAVDMGTKAGRSAGQGQQMQAWCRTPRFLAR